MRLLVGEADPCLLAAEGTEHQHADAERQHNEAGADQQRDRRGARGEAKRGKRREGKMGEQGVGSGWGPEQLRRES